MRIDINTRYPLATHKEDEGLTYKEQKKVMLELSNASYNQWQKDHPILDFICRSLNIDVRKITKHFAMKSFCNTVNEINMYVSMTTATLAHLDGACEVNKTFKVNVGYGGELDILVKIQSFKDNGYHFPLEVATVVSSNHSLVMLNPYPLNNSSLDNSKRYAFEIPDAKPKCRDNGTDLMAVVYDKSKNLDDLAENYKYLVSANIVTEVVWFDRYHSSDSSRARQSMCSVDEEVVISTMKRELNDENSKWRDTDHQNLLLPTLPELLIKVFKGYALEGYGRAMDILKPLLENENARQALDRMMQMVKDDPTRTSILQESIIYLQRILTPNTPERNPGKF